MSPTAIKDRFAAVQTKGVRSFINALYLLIRWRVTMQGSHLSWFSWFFENVLNLSWFFGSVLKKNLCPEFLWRSVFVPTIWYMHIYFSLLYCSIDVEQCDLLSSGNTTCVNSLLPTVASTDHHVHSLLYTEWVSASACLLLSISVYCECCHSNAAFEYMCLLLHYELVSGKLHGSCMAWWQAAWKSKVDLFIL